MFLKVIPSFALLVALATSENCYSFDEKDFQQLTATKICVGCELSYADLTGLDLRNANLSGSNLQYADLSKNDLSGVNLSGSNLVGVKLPAFHHPKDLLACAGLLGINFHDPIYSHSDGGVNFESANLSHANLSGLDLAGAFFVDANLSNANLSNSYLDGAILGRTNLTNANLTSASLSGANLSGANLTGANLSNAIFKSAFLLKASLAAAKIQNTDFCESGTQGGGFNLCDPEAIPSCISKIDAYRQRNELGSNLRN